MTSFRKQLWLIILDNLLIGLVILMLKFVLDRQLDDYQTRKAFEQSVAIRRVDEINSLWAHMNAFEARVIATGCIVDDLYSKYQNDSNALLSAKTAQYDPQADIISKETLELFKEIDKKQFWLGLRIHNELQAFVISWDAFLVAHVKKDQNAISEAIHTCYKHRLAINAEMRNICDR